ncbi:hypothetical protein ST37_13580 [Vibrio sp. qd031]|uniref:YeaC family protein n=1 Tax=Vibrio sp. qd031 TaxID=1603038 RepID=UPI000A0FED9E|nr:DUF1315 family protein [Vibrio sp. qd031]ORT49429.1 hypothetical protein ST37_13580 [Vibrio sp. qd031]
MNKQQLIESITPEAYDRLLYAVETGRWPEGTELTKEQRDHCMQAVMMYQSVHNENPQHMSVATDGEIAFKSKAELKQQFIPQQSIDVQELD